MKIRCFQCGALVRVVAGRLVSHRRPIIRYLNCIGSGADALPLAEADSQRIRAREADCVEEVSRAEARLAGVRAELALNEAALAKLRKRAAKGGAK